MHELTRRAYLDAMGVSTYVSRYQLSGSAPTSKLAVLERPLAKPRSEPGPAPVAKPTLATSARPRISGFDNEADQLPVAGPRPASAKTSTTAVEFSVTAFRTGNWLWLEERPRAHALLRDQVLLVQAMAHALGWGKHQAEVSHFNWPIHTNNQLDLGADAARASLGGFVGRKLEQVGCQGLVVLGSSCRQWLAIDQLGEHQFVTTISTAQMLLDPLQKKQVWRDLLSFAK